MLANYRRYIDDDIEPVLHVPGATFVGLNTSHGVTRETLTWRLRDISIIGIVRREQIERLRASSPARRPDDARVDRHAPQPGEGRAVAAARPQGHGARSSARSPTCAWTSCSAATITRTPIHYIEHTKKGTVISTAGTVSNRMRGGRPSSVNSIRITADADRGVHARLVGVRHGLRPGPDEVLQALTRFFASARATHVAARSSRFAGAAPRDADELLARLRALGLRAHHALPAHAQPQRDGELRRRRAARARGLPRRAGAGAARHRVASSRAARAPSGARRSGSSSRIPVAVAARRRDAPRAHASRGRADGRRSSSSGTRATTRGTSAAGSGTIDDPRLAPDEEPARPLLRGHARRRDAPRSRSAARTCAGTAGTRRCTRCCTRWCTSGRTRRAARSITARPSGRSAREVGIAPYARRVLATRPGRAEGSQRLGRGRRGDSRRRVRS